MSTTKMICLTLLALALAALVAACGNSTPQSDNESHASANTGAADNPTRTVTDGKGEQLVPAEPARVAVTYFALTELLLVLEQPPVAANYFDDFIAKLEALQPYYSNTEITDIGSYNEINLEQLLEIAPDLIIAAGAANDPSGNDPIYDRLTAIAPVFYLDADALNADWKWGLREVAQALNREAKADEVIAAFDSALLQSNTALTELQAQSVLFVDLQEGGFYVWGTERLSDYYDGLGLTMPEAYDGASQPMSLEGLSVLDPDHLFIHNRPDAASEQLKTELEENPVWNLLRAVKNDQVYMLESSAFSPGPIGTLYGVNAITDALLNR